MRRLLLFLSAFIGVGAYWGALMMFIDPTGAVWGMDPLLPIMQANLPFVDIFFRDFLWSGIALLLVNGVSNTIAWYALIKNRPRALTLQLICGLLLAAWLGVQWVIFEVNALTTLYTFIAMLQILLATMLRSGKC